MFPTEYKQMNYPLAWPIPWGNSLVYFFLNQIYHEKSYTKL